MDWLLDYCFRTDCFLVSTLLVVLGFLLLIKGADLLVSGASSLAKTFHIPDLVIGLTVVAMGTSAPELVVNLFSAGKVGEINGVEVVFGNIIGSNMFNTFVILGIASLIYPLDVRFGVLKKDLPYSFVAIVLLFFLVNDHLFSAGNNALNMVDAIVLVVLFVVFLTHTFLMVRRGGEGEEIEDITSFPVRKSLLYVLLGMAGLACGGELAVVGAVNIATVYGISGRMIGLTVLAVGTSLPELATTVVAALQRKSDLAVGNVVGSNIFNILLVLGATGIVANTKGIDVFYNLQVNNDIYFFIFGMLLLVLFMFTFKARKIDRSEGIVFLLCYAIYFYMIL